MFDTEFAKFLATLGVGGVLAGVMFFFYRRDMQAHAEVLRAERNVLIEVVKENTSSNTKLVTVIEALQRSLDKDRWTRS